MPETGGHVVYDPIYMKCPAEAVYGDTESRRLVAAWG